MKKIIQKGNRGIILGVAALLLLSVYIAAGHILFAPEKPVVRDLIIDYLLDCEAANLLPQTYTGLAASDNFINSKNEKINELADKYFADENAVAVLTNQRIAETLNDCLQTNIKNGAYIEQCGFSLNNISQISKYGRNAAVVNFTVTSDIVASPDVLYLNLFSSSTAENQIKLHSGTVIEMNFIVLMAKSNETWRFSELLDYSLSTWESY